MNLLVQIIIVTIPPCIVAALSYFLIRNFLGNDQKKKLLEMQQEKSKETQKVLLPLRLQAYERLALFLERIHPNNLLLRSFSAGMGLRDLQVAMTQSIRDEFEHNLSQQIYISPELWHHIKSAKEEMINLINSSAFESAEKADPTALAAKIFQLSAQNQLPCEWALDMLKKEFSDLI